MTKLEKEIEAKLVKVVKNAGGLCLKWVCPGWAGVPDRICLLPGGRIYFVETKRPKGGVMSRRQMWWRKTLQGLGFWYAVAWNEGNLKTLELIIKEEAASTEEVRWSKTGPCPVTPEQFEAIYADEEDWLA